MRKLEAHFAIQIRKLHIWKRKLDKEIWLQKFTFAIFRTNLQGNNIQDMYRRKSFGTIFFLVLILEFFDNNKLELWYVTFLCTRLFNQLNLFYF